MKKRVLAILLALAMIAALLPCIVLWPIAIIT